MERYEVYVGLNDKDVLNDNLSEEKVREDFMNHFSKYHINFSLSIIYGGYIREDGGYVLENTIKTVSICEKKPEGFDEVIEYIKKIYNQETVLIVKQQIESEYRS